MQNLKLKSKYKGFNLSYKTSLKEIR